MTKSKVPRLMGATPGSIPVNGESSYNEEELKKAKNHRSSVRT